MRKMVKIKTNRRPVGPGPRTRGAQIPSFPRTAITLPKSLPVRKSRAQILISCTWKRVKFPLTCVRGGVCGRSALLCGRLQDKNHKLLSKSPVKVQRGSSELQPGLGRERRGCGALISRCLLTPPAAACWSLSRAGSVCQSTGCGEIPALPSLAEVS